jgi:hypothetical protein
VGELKGTIERLYAWEAPSPSPVLRLSEKASGTLPCLLCFEAS